MAVYRHDPYAAASPVVSVRPGRSGSDASSHTVVSCSSPLGSLHRHDSYSSGASSQATAVGNTPAAAAPAAAPHYRRVDSFGSAGSAVLAAAAASACCSPAAAPAAPAMPSPVLPLASSVSVHSFGSKVTDSDSDASGGAASACGGHHHHRPSSPPVLPRARARVAAAAASAPPLSAVASSPPSEAAAGDAAEAEGGAGAAAGATGYIVDLVHRHGRHQRYRAAVSYAKGTYVIVAADRGVDLGKVAGCRVEGSRTGRIAGSVERVATAAEVDKCLGKLAQHDAVAAEKMRQLVAEYDVPIRIHSAEYQFDKKKLTFSYESDVEKPDWRPVLKAAFDTFRCRIWLSNRL